MMTHPDAAITANQLTLRRDSTTILDGVSFSLPAGAVLGLVGRNGAGKSTLLRCLAGLAEPDSGASTLLGCASTELSDPVRARLGYVAQAPDLFEWMTVLEHLQLVGRAYPRWDETRCMVLAARLQLSTGARVSDLSGGDQQKLAVVLALAHDPDLLLLDEPVASLDPLTRQEFMRAMFGNRDDSERTVVISSHILTDLERVVSHVAFMRKGRLQLLDTWDAMLEHLRLVPVAQANIPPEAVVACAPGARQMVIDTRRTDGQVDIGRAMSLTELFAELNA
ncbi:MAG: ABC transporter ATP-binding protein [Pseudomonadota bacterium]